MSATSSPLLQLAGAVPAPEGTLDAAVPWHHGDPFAEQRAATRTAVVVDRSHRDVLVIPGEDRLSWLHSLTSQNFTALPDGSATEALLLDPNGRVEHHMVVSEIGGRVWLDTEAGHGAPLLAYLEKMRFWSKVEPADATAQRAVLTLLGPSTVDTLRTVGLPVPDQGRTATSASTDDDAVLVRRQPWRTLDAVDLLVIRANLRDWWQRLTEAGARPAGTLAYEALRAEALRPRLGVDTDQRTIPHEVGWIGTAVHLDKGCYRGQETVARVSNLGRPPRRMLLLHLDGTDALPETGEDVLLDGRTVGRIGTVAQHHELGPVALALVKHAVPVDARLHAGAPDRPALIDPDSVPPDTGEPPGRAALRRLGR